MNTAKIILKSLEAAVPIVGIIATALVAIISIRKTADANRVSSVHSEMLKCIVESVGFFRKTSILLDDVARRVSYYNYKAPEYELIESAYDRYWNRIDELVTSFNAIQSKQKFVFPKNLYDKGQNLIDRLNKARDEAKDLAPDNPNFDSASVRLKEILKEINSIYVDFVHEARGYVGVDALRPLSFKKEQIIGVEESKETGKS